MMRLHRTWHEAYLNKPWAAVPRPPETFNCGELVRAVHRDLLGIDSPPIPVPDAANRRACINAMRPERYGLVRLPVGVSPRELDVAFIVRQRLRDHVGIAVATADGLMILHCPQVYGVVLSAPVDMAGVLQKIEWYRHPDIDAALSVRGITLGEPYA